MKPSLRARGTLKDVAKAVGVSHTTVSNAFNRPDQLSSGLRERVVATARSMSYPGAESGCADAADGICPDDRGGMDRSDAARF
jgi:Bacterial regulatory proteins, lacI family